MKKRVMKNLGWLSGIALSAGLLAPVYAANGPQPAAENVQAGNDNTQAVEAYRSELSQSWIVWGDGTVDSQEVQFAPADLNGDGVLELMVYAGGVTKHQNDGYYELWSWQNGVLCKAVDFPYFNSPVSYDPGASVVLVDGAIKGIWYDDLYRYDQGHLSCFLSHLENPDGYGSWQGTRYQDGMQNEITEGEYQAARNSAIGNGENLIPFTFYDNTSENRENVLIGQGVAGEASNGESQETPSADAVPSEEMIHSYQVFVENCTWTEAAERCLSMGGYLAQINDEAEFQKITALLESSESYRGKVFYLGGQRALNDTQYYWTDLFGNSTGEAALNSPESWAYSHWGPGEPSYTDRGTEEYLISIFKYNGVWILNDEPHSMLNTAPEYDGYIGYICETETPAAGNSGTGEMISPQAIFTGVPTLYYTSGVGAWHTELVIAPDGSFTGIYGDTDSGYSYEQDGYNAIYYNCAFLGQFTNIRKVNEYTYAMEITGMNKWMDDSWSDPYIKFEYVDSPGLENGDTVYFYLPGIPSSMTEAGYQEWIKSPKAWSSVPAVLDFYGLYDSNRDTSFID